MSKPLILELKETTSKLLKRITINQDTTDLVVEVKLDKTSEIVFNGVVADNLYIIPNSDKLNFCRTTITQNYEKGGTTDGDISSITRYQNQEKGLWFVRGLANTQSFARATLKRDSNNNTMLLANCGSMSIDETMFCNMYSITRTNISKEIEGIKFLGTIKAGAEIEIYTK